MKIKKFNTHNKCLILHGMPSKSEYFDEKSPSPSNFCWYPYVQKQLSLKNISTQTPEFPEPYNPDYEKWSEIITQFKIDESTILIGHSCGAGFLLRYLSENKITIAKLILVAPWLDPNKRLTNGFFDFQIEKSMFNSDICLYYSTDDEEEVLQSVITIKTVFPNLNIRKFKDKDHFTFKEFPEILDDIL